MNRNSGSVAGNSGKALIDNFRWSPILLPRGFTMLAKYYPFR